MGMVRVKRLVLAASVSLLMAPAAQAGLLSKWDELTVKGGELESCPGVTLEQQADSFFKDPEWSAGKATDGRKLVNVSGTFTYGDRPVRGLLQMWVQGEEFSVEALEINGQPQPDVMIDALLSKMCEAAQSQQPKEVKGNAQARADLPFVGKRRFNFSGGGVVQPSSLRSRATGILLWRVAARNVALILKGHSLTRSRRSTGSIESRPSGFSSSIRREGARPARRSWETQEIQSAV